jgi:hypothetical protein
MRGQERHLDIFASDGRCPREGREGSALRPATTYPYAFISGVPGTPPDLSTRRVVVSTASRRDAAAKPEDRTRGDHQHEQGDDRPRHASPPRRLVIEAKRCSSATALVRRRHLLQMSQLVRIAHHV